MGVSVKKPRTHAACNVCRKRKLKCDKGKPYCVRCKKSCLTDQCQYPLPSWLHRTNSNDQTKESRTEKESRTKSHHLSEDLSNDTSWYTSNLQPLEGIAFEVGSYASDPFLSTLNLESTFPFDCPFCDSVKEQVQKTCQKKQSANDKFESLLFIERIFPRRATFWDLIDTFFKSVYPFVPFLDKHMFCDEITRLTGPRLSEQPKVTLKIEKKLDFARVGLLLVVLRLAYLVNPDKSFHVSQEAIKVARYCFKSFRVLKKSNLAMLQMTLFLHIYETFAPESEMFLSSVETHLFTGVLLQMALAMGINRDPSKYSPGIQRDYKACNLCRKIWFYIFALDTQQSTVGLPPQANSHLFDTALPVVDESADLVEKVVISNAEEQYNADEERRTILKHVFALGDIPQVAVVIELVSKMEKTMQVPFLDIASIPQVYRMKRFLEKCTFLCWLHYNLFLHHKARQNTLSLYHLERIISLVIQVTTCCSAVQSLSPEFRFFLVPTLERSVNIILLFQYSLLLSQCTVESFAERLTRNVERGLESLGHFTETYYYAWRSYRVQSYIYSRVRELVSQRHFPNKQDTQSDNILGQISLDPVVLPEVSQHDEKWLTKYAERLTSELENIGQSNVNDVRAVLEETFFDDIL